MGASTERLGSTCRLFAIPGRAPTGTAEELGTFAVEVSSTDEKDRMWQAFRWASPSLIDTELAKAHTTTQMATMLARSAERIMILNWLW